MIILVATMFAGLSIVALAIAFSCWSACTSISRNIQSSPTAMGIFTITFGGLEFIALMIMGFAYMYFRYYQRLGVA